MSAGVHTGSVGFTPEVVGFTPEVAVVHTGSGGGSHRKWRWFTPEVVGVHTGSGGGSHWMRGVHTGSGGVHTGSGGIHTGCGRGVASASYVLRVRFVAPERAAKTPQWCRDAARDAYAMHLPRGSQLCQMLCASDSNCL